LGAAEAISPFRLALTWRTFSFSSRRHAGSADSDSVFSTGERGCLGNSISLESAKALVLLGF
ncbi:MAG TPA: hypothetical protein VN345_19435, partial [Blastocatellia bacterium]|nr:hypothetical protein [Blastocatellia bacterium]